MGKIRGRNLIVVLVPQVLHGAFVGETEKGIGEMVCHSGGVDRALRR